MMRRSPGDEEAESAWRRRTPSEHREARVARLLAYDWDILSVADQRAALLAAYSFGVDLAIEVVKDDDEAYGDAKDYRRVCIRWAYEDARVINDVEAALWKNVDDDPRMLAFQRGFIEGLRGR